MARMIHKELERWLGEDRSRKAIVLPGDITGGVMVRLSGVALAGAFAGKVVTIWKTMQCSESGISGGGSADDGWTMVVKKWRELAGEAVHRGAT